MSDEIFDKLAPLYAQAERIVLGGCGEPLISAKLQSRLKMIRSVNPKAHLSTFTNGQRLASEKTLEKLVPFFNEIHVSVNGVESYGNVMTGGSFAKLEKNLGLLRDFRKRTGKPESLVMGFIVMCRNLEDITAAVNLAQKYGFDHIQFKNLWVFNYAMKSESVHHSAKLKQAARAEIVKAGEMGFSISCEIWPELSSSNLSQNDSTMDIVFGKFNRFFSDKQLNLKSIMSGAKQLLRKCKKLSDDSAKSRISKFDPPCRFPWDEVQIVHNGNVLLCCNGITKIGNLEQNTFDQIWNGEEAARYRLGLTSRNYYKDCAKCKIVMPHNSAAFERQY